MIAGRLDRAWCDAAVCANPERSPDFDKPLPEATDLFLFFVDHLGLACHLPLNGFEVIDLSLQSGDVIVFFAQPLLVESEFGLELVNQRVYVLRSGRFGRCLPDSLGVFGFPGIASRFLLPQLRMELFEFADAPVSFGQLAVDFVQRGSMLAYPVR